MLPNSDAQFRKIIERTCFVSRLQFEEVKTQKWASFYTIVRGEGRIGNGQCCDMVVYYHKFWCLHQCRS